MNYNNLKIQAHENACRKGFWESSHSQEHCIMLVITEISEAVEADRKGERFNEYNSSDYKLYQFGEKHGDIKSAYEAYIKGSIEDELADAAIRLLDLAGHLEIDFDYLSPCRYYRAFNRFPFTENAFTFIKGLMRDQYSIEKRVQSALEYLRMWSEQLGIDLEWFIIEKMKYNETREVMHGKNY